MNPADCKLIASITASSPGEMARLAEAALQRGADLVELRLDYLENVAEQELQALVGRFGERCIIALRPVDEGGRFTGTDQEQWDLLTAASRGRPRLTDAEFAKVRGSANIHYRASQAQGRDGLILSVHDFRGRPAKLQRSIEDLVAEPHCAVIKAAWKARQLTDNFEAFEITRNVPKPAIAVCMGEAGLLSRVLAGKFGAFGTYCSSGPGREAAPGQLTLADMKELYHFDRINADTEVYGVVGCPVAHSMSPTIFNQLFEWTRTNAVYLPMLVLPGQDDFRDFIRQVLARPWLDIRGLSVTLPHKEHAFRLCREALDEVSLRSGAVNTLTVVGDKVSGRNTDAPAALAALTAGLGCSNQDLAGLGVDLLGAGGVARAVLAALTGAGCKPTVYNRTAHKSAELAAAFGCQVKPWDQRAKRRGQVLINCTSLGMWPKTGESPMPAAGLESGVSLVFDTVYNPPVTHLLADAEACGCRTVSGLEMFVRQAAGQFEAWTGRPAPRESMAELVRARLAGTSPQPDQGP